MLDPCPCNGCKDRRGYPNCHSEDERYCSHGYIAWRNRQKEMKAAKVASEKATAAVDGCKIDAMKRVRRRQHSTTNNK